MSNLDAINRLTLGVVARELCPPDAPEDLWHWLSCCWADLFELTRQAHLAVDEVDGLLAQADGQPRSALAQIPSLLAQLASVAMDLHQQRDSEQREPVEKALEPVVGDLRRALLNVGQAIGWHPRHLGAMWGDAYDGRHRGVMLPALHLRSGWTPERLLTCYRGTLRGAETDGKAVSESLDAMDQALHGWRELFADVCIPARGVSRGLLSLRDDVSLFGLQQLLREVRRDVDCLVKGALAWQVERNISLAPMMFAARRLSVDIEEMRQIAAT